MQGVRCKSCDCLNRAGSLVCRACGEKLPAPRAAASPPPAKPPRILRPKQPAPLRPDVDYDKLPAARVETRPRATPIEDDEPAATAEVPSLRGQPDTVPEARAEQMADDDTVLADASDPSDQLTVSEEADEASADAADTEPPEAAASPSAPDVGGQEETVEVAALPPEELDDAPAVPATPAAARADAAPRPARPKAAAQGALRRNVRRAASGWRVLLASVIDGVLALAVAAGVVVGVAPSADKAELATTGPLQLIELAILNPLLIAVLASTVVAASLLHQALLVPRLGGTLGERLAGIVVITLSTGGPPGFSRAALRGAVGAVAGLALAIGPLYALWLSAYRRGPGDLVAGTARVRREGSAR